MTKISTSMRNNPACVLKGSKKKAKCSTISCHHADVPPATGFPEECVQRLKCERVFAVVTIERADEAIPLAQALIAGGIHAIELAWRTSAAEGATKAIHAAFPNMCLGAGTLLTAEQVDRAQAAGATFGVSPGFSVITVQAAKRAKFPFAPGVQTASDLQGAIEQGCRMLKYFPAVTAGGLEHLSAISGPFAHLGLQFLPLGGVTERNAAEYLAHPSVAAIGGSWIVPGALIRNAAWREIKQRASSARRLVSGKKSIL